MKIGVAFGDSISQEKLSERRSYDAPFGKPTLRNSFLVIVFIVTFSTLIIRLVYLQIIHGNYYRYLSNENRIKTVILHAPRGILFDRNKIPLVFNTPGYRKTENEKTILISREIALEAVAKGEQNLEVDSLRQYPFGEAMAHVIGYIGQISKEELSDPKFSMYKAGDVIGKSGVEKQYENKLKGVDGKQLVEIDALGKPIRILGQTDPIPGNDIVLNIDAKLTNVSYKALKDIKRGVVVVTTPKGEVLTLVSKPSFNPNLFSGFSSSASAYTSIDQILTDSENQPLLNRAISGVYPPGSTFKLITAASGLENNIIDESFEVQDTGVIHVGAFSFSNWYFTGYGKTEGKINVIKAIKRSNDIFFYLLADKIGVDKLSKTAQSFGIGEKSGIDLEGEVEGLVPDESWKQKELKEPWYLGDSYNFGIGQGYLLTTPLQVNGWTRAIAAFGTLYEPHVLKSSKFKIQNSKLMSEKTLELIRKGMIESCSPGGVAWPLFKLKTQNPKLKTDGRNFLALSASESAGLINPQDYREIVIACKTGTAQHGDEKTLPHAWITLFAPAYDPQIVITVLAESSGEGSNMAAPVAKKILEEWFSR